MSETAGDLERARRYCAEQVGKPFNGWPMKLYCGHKLWPSGVFPEDMTSNALSVLLAHNGHKAGQCATPR